MKHSSLVLAGVAIVVCTGIVVCIFGGCGGKPEKRRPIWKPGELVGKWTSVDTIKWEEKYLPVIEVTLDADGSYTELIRKIENDKLVGIVRNGVWKEDAPDRKDPDQSLLPYRKNTFLVMIATKPLPHGNAEVGLEYLSKYRRLERTGLGKLSMIDQRGAHQALTWDRE